MKLDSFLKIKTVISLGFGIVFMILPAAAMSLLGSTLDPAGTLMARLFGACLTGIGLICWLDKDAQRAALQNIVLALFIADSAGFIISLLGQLSGLLNPLGWVIVAVWLFLAAGLGYFRFLKNGQ